MARIVQTPLAVTSGANTPVVAKTFARYVEIEEDGAAAPAGIVITWPNGAVTTHTPAQQPVVLGNKGGALGAPTSPAIGVPANYNGGGGPATVYCSVKSVGATGAVRVSEWN